MDVRTTTQNVFLNTHSMTQKPVRKRKKQKRPAQGKKRRFNDIFHPAPGIRQFYKSLTRNGRSHTTQTS
jgi:hypothetical protein